MSDYEPAVPKVIDGLRLKGKLDELLVNKRIDSDVWNVVVTKLRACGLDIQLLVEDPEPRRRARIEAAIRVLDPFTESPKYADLLRWVLGQEQDTWKDEDLGLETKKEG